MRSLQIGGLYGEDKEVADWASGALGFGGGAEEGSQLDSEGHFLSTDDRGYASYGIEGLLVSSLVLDVEPVASTDALAIEEVSYCPLPADQQLRHVDATAFAGMDNLHQMAAHAVSLAKELAISSSENVRRLKDRSRQG